MITANPDVDVALFITAFNQLVDIHVVNILAIAERENYPINLTDFMIEDKDDIFDEEWDLSHAPSSNPDSGTDEAQRAASIVAQEQNQVNYAARIQALALSMFDGLSKLGKETSSESKGGKEQEIPQTSTDKANDEQRDLKLANDCRELLQIQGQDNGSQVTFERPDGKGNYKFSLEKSSDTITLKAKDHPVNPVLVESKGKIIESHATDLDAINIAKAVEMLNAQQSQPSENQK